MRRNFACSPTGTCYILEIADSVTVCVTRDLDFAVINKTVQATIISVVDV